MNPKPLQKERNVPPFAYPIIERLPLLKPNIFPKIDFITCINKRKSVRNFNPLDLNDISRILWITAKVKSLNIQSNGYILTHRASPSAGARHPIDILIKYDEYKELLYYNPIDHSLNKLVLSSKIVKSLDSHSKNILVGNKGITVWFIAHENRTSAKYKNHKSLVWRDAGALIYCFQIVCTALGINSCPLGTLGEPFLSRAFASFGKIEGVGGLILG